MKQQPSFVTWHLVDVHVGSRTHSQIWMRVSCNVKEATSPLWSDIMDRVCGRGWRPFSPEYEGPHDK